MWQSFTVRLWRVAALAALVSGTMVAAAQSPPGPSPVSSGTFHSSPEIPDKPRSWGDGLPPPTNPSTNELSKQPSVGGRDQDGSDPSRPAKQGSQFQRS